MKYQVILETVDTDTAPDRPGEAMGWDVFSLCVLAFHSCPGVTVVSAAPVAGDTLALLPDVTELDA